MSTKEEFHKLIDNIQDEQLLKSYYNLIQKLNKHETGDLWNSLTEKQQQELMLSYDESHDPQNLISQDHVQKQHDKWLKR